MIKCMPMERRTWYVLHVKPRTEKKLNDFLAAMRVFHYLPLVRKDTKVQRRKVVRFLPVFPGYVFTRLFPDERIRVLETKNLVRMIDVADPRLFGRRQDRHGAEGAERTLPERTLPGDVLRHRAGERSASCHPDDAGLRPAHEIPSRRQLRRSRLQACRDGGAPLSHDSGGPSGGACRVFG